MASTWLKNLNILIDSLKQVILCNDCPCDTGTGTGTGTDFPIENTCCPDNPIPRVLYLTIVSPEPSGTGTGPGLCNTTIQLIWVGGLLWRFPLTPTTFGNCTFSDGDPAYIQLSCDFFSGFWDFDFIACPFPFPADPGMTMTAFSCDPFYMEWEVHNFFACSLTTDLQRCCPDINNLPGRIIITE